MRISLNALRELFKTSYVIMNAKQFFVMVARMRDAQRQYFKHRTNDNLQTALQLEQDIDKEILRVKLSLSQQEINDLFNQ
jgi:hypothetical protein